MAMKDFDWTSLLTALGSAGAQYGMDRTKKYNDIRQQESYYDAMSNANSAYLEKLKALYAPELKGELQASEIAAREKLIGRAKADTGAAQARTAQNLARSGVTGGKVAGQATAAPEAALGEYTSDLDAQLLAGADARRSAALGTVAQAEGQASMQEAPMQAQINALKQGLGDYKLEDMQQYLAAPLLMALLGGGVNKAQGGGTVDTGAMVRQSSLEPLLQRFGLSTEMFAPGDEQLPTEIADTVYTPKKGKSNFFGKSGIEYDKELSATVQAKLGGTKPVDPAKLKSADDLLFRSGVDSSKTDNNTYNSALSYVLKMGQVPEIQNIKIDGKKQDVIVVERGGKKYYYLGTGDMDDAKNWKLIK